MEDSENWVALPQRKRNRRNIEANRLDTNKDSFSNRIEPYDKNKVDNAIIDRTNEERALNSLGAKDGCDSEYYECIYLKYLDHTADVQLHAWGNTLSEAFSNVVPCMFNYITDLSTVNIDESLNVEFNVKGHDMSSLLYAYLDEFLFRFCTDNFCCKKVIIKELNREDYSIAAQGLGERFDLKKHTQGTEVKAITYSNMQIHETDSRADVYVIIDI